LFNDDSSFIVYTHQEKEFKYPVVTRDRISLRDIKKLAEENLGKPRPTVLICGGAVMFELMIQSRDIPEFLVLTENNGSVDGRTIAGKIDNETLQEHYEEIFGSRIFVNEFGNWKIRVLKRKEHISEDALT
jgi:dihydrofolate reductase